MSKNTITLMRGARSWLAAFAGSGAAELRELFGAAIIPTAFNLSAEPAEVITWVQQRFPAWEVNLEDRAWVVIVTVALRADAPPALAGQIRPEDLGRHCYGVNAPTAEAARNIGLGSFHGTVKIRDMRWVNLTAEVYLDENGGAK